MSHGIPHPAADVTCHGLGDRNAAPAEAGGGLRPWEGMVQGWGACAARHPCTVPLVAGSAGSLCSALVDRVP